MTKENILDMIEKEIENLKKESSYSYMSDKYYNALDNKIEEAETIKNLVKGMEDADN